MGVFDQPARCRRVTAFGTHEVLIPPDDAYARMIEHFHRAVADPSLALNPAEDGVAQARMMEALATSAANKGAPQVIGEA
jgi:predicted dehydrogenase